MFPFCFLTWGQLPGRGRYIYIYHAVRVHHENVSQCRAWKQQRARGVRTRKRTGRVAITEILVSKRNPPTGRVIEAHTNLQCVPERGRNFCRNLDEDLFGRLVAGLAHFVHLLFYEVGDRRWRRPAGDNPWQAARANNRGTTIGVHRALQMSSIKHVGSSKVTRHGV